jgi:TonB family protein
VSTLAASSPELKQLWVRVIKRVHPDLAVDDQDRFRCERLTQQANEAYARGDEIALRAVLKLNTLPPFDPEEREKPAPDASQPPSPAPGPLRAATRREEIGILCSAGVVLCLLLYGILQALRQEVGRGAALFFLAILAVTAIWWIMRRSHLPENHKAKFAAGAAAGMIVLGIFLMHSQPKTVPFLSSRTANAGSLATAITYEDHAVALSPHYWEGIKSRLAESWNPSAVTGAPAGATAEVAFTIAKDGSPHDISLRQPSGSLSLDTSCMVAVQQVRTFGPPDGGVQSNVKIVYPCSYDELSAHTRVAQASLVSNATAAARPRADSPASLVEGYVQSAKQKVAENWDPSDVIGAPSGATVYIQFIIWPHGNHDVPMTETSSGYPSLDGSCLRAVERIKNFGHLPRGYEGSNMTVFYQCTYAGMHSRANTTAVSDHRADRTMHDGPVNN